MVKTEGDESKNVKKNLVVKKELSCYQLLISA